MSECSYLPTDGDGNVIGEVPVPKGKGRRICMIGGCTKYGHIITHYPEGHPKAGQPVIDCDWVDANNNHVDHNGTFVELNNQGKPRKLYGRSSYGKIGSMNATQLKAVAVDLGIIGAETHATKAQLLPLVREELKQMKEAQKVLANMSRFELPGGRFDYEGFRASLLDMAITTDKFMIANESKGDYHKNFDSYSFFKWVVAMELTYPVFCQELQAKFERHRAGIERYPFFSDNESDFWINDKPARELIMILDNAPYHHGVHCQIRNKTKDEIAELLRHAGIEYIAVSKPNGDVMNYEVPKEGEKWEHNNPSADDLKAAALKELKKIDPHIDKPAYFSIIESKKGKWGPEGSKGWSVIFSAPYVSTHVAVELKWAFGKNFVANPANRSVDMSVAMLTSTLRERWYSHPHAPMKWFDMAHDFIWEFIT